MSIDTQTLFDLGLTAGPDSSGQTAVSLPPSLPATLPEVEGPVLLVAYQCGPGMGSVSQIGWQWFTGMAQRREVCLVTHERNRAAIERARDKPLTSRIIYIDTEWFAGPLYRLASRLFPSSQHSVFLVSQIDFFVFDRVALKRLKRELADGADWPVVHLVTPVTVSAPTVLHRLGLPLVRGPLNCGLPVPKGFPDLMATESMGLARLRVLTRWLDHWLGSLKNSAAILVATEATRAAVPQSVRSRCIKMLENAVDCEAFSPGAPLPPPLAGSPLRIAFVGRLVPVKALNLLLHAMARLRDEKVAVHLSVAGDGPMAGTWRELATELGLDSAVTWLGDVTLAQVPGVMRDCHVFCLPSIRESGGAVLLEAMACARPVIAMNFGGPAEIVDDSVGRRVDGNDEASAINGLVDALRDVADFPDDWSRRGDRGRRRVERDHTWAAKMAAADVLYQRLSLVGRVSEARESAAPKSHSAAIAVNAASGM
jgi:glycosyltransferase involved in cell wall biosynthesis